MLVKKFPSVGGGGYVFDVEERPPVASVSASQLSHSASNNFASSMPEDTMPNLSAREWDRRGGSASTLVGWVATNILPPWKPSR